MLVEFGEGLEPELNLTVLSTGQGLKLESSILLESRRKRLAEREEAGDSETTRAPLKQSEGKALQMLIAKTSELFLENNTTQLIRRQAELAGANKTKSAENTLNQSLCNTSRNSSGLMQLGAW